MDPDLTSDDTDLCTAAVGLCRNGWPVVPIIPSTGVPVIHRPPGDPALARQWWQRRPYGIGLVLGDHFDVVEIPSWLGQLVFPTVEHLATVWENTRPLTQRWYFLVTPGSPVVFEFQHLVPGARLHQRGALPLPPTSGLGGLTRWVTRHYGRAIPDRLPHSLTLQGSAIKATTAARTTHTTRSTGTQP